MNVFRSWTWLTLAATLIFVAPLPAQESALKGSVALSKFAASGGTSEWDDDLTTTNFGGHVRFPFGPIAIQPELQVVTRGARRSGTTAEDEQLRLEYLEVPVSLVLPVRAGRLELYAFGGGMVALETRCRYQVKEEGLRSNFGCDSQQTATVVFDRRKVDYGVQAGAGVSYPLGSGRVLLEARQTWGLNNISKTSPEIRNRTTTLALGYAIRLQPSRE